MWEERHFSSNIISGHGTFIKLEPLLGVKFRVLPRVRSLQRRGADISDCCENKTSRTHYEFARSANYGYISNAPFCSPSFNFFFRFSVPRATRICNFIAAGTISRSSRVSIIFLLAIVANSEGGLSTSGSRKGGNAHSLFDRYRVQSLQQV